MAGGSRSTWLIPFEVGLAMVCGCWFATGGVVRGWLSASPRLFADRVSSHRCNGRDRRATAVPAATLEGWPDWGNAHADNAFLVWRRWGAPPAVEPAGRAAHDRIPVVSPVRGQPSTANTDETPLHHVRRNRPQSSAISTAADARPPRGRQGSAAPPSPQQPMPGCRWRDGSCAFARENAPVGR